MAGSGAIAFAQKLLISLVNSPRYTATDSFSSLTSATRFDQELASYFQTTRTFELHDHFTVTSFLDSNVQYQFQIVDVEPKHLIKGPFCVNRTNTTLSQTEGSIRAKFVWPPAVTTRERATIRVLDVYVRQAKKMMKFYSRHHEAASDAELPVMLLSGPSGCGKSQVVAQVCEDLSVHLCQVNAVNLAGESASAVEKRIEIFLQQAVNYGPCIILIKSFQFLFKLKDINEFNKRLVSSFFQTIRRLKQQQINAAAKSFGDPKLFKFFVVCTTSSKQLLDAAISSHFNYELEIHSLSKEQSADFLRAEFQIILESKHDENSETKTASHKIAPSCSTNEFRLSVNDLDDVLATTTGLFYGETKTLFDLVKQQQQMQRRTASPNQTQSSCNDKDYDTRSESGAASFAYLFKVAYERFTAGRKFEQENKLNIGAVRWTDVGGLVDIKTVITDTIMLPLTYPLLFSSGSSNSQLSITRSGILLYGPPGTGKTLLAKAIANECGLRFLSVKGPELLDMYVGQTELNVRTLFEKARLNAPCILFFDELDSLAPVRGRAGDSGGVMDRVVSQLLTEIDGLDKYALEHSADSAGGGDGSTTSPRGQIFLIAATNRPDLIDQSLLRPGRFDKLVYVPIAKSSAERKSILSALLTKLPVASNFDIDSFVELCPANLSGADFYSITSRARQNALRRLIAYLESTHSTTAHSINDALISITDDDMRLAVKELKATLSEQTLVEYEKYFASYSNSSGL